MKLLVILIAIVCTCFQFYLKYLNYKNRNQPVPDNVKDVFDAETYQKRFDYEMENTRHGIFSGLCSLILGTVFLATNFHSYLFAKGGLIFDNENVYLLTFFMFGITMLFGLVIGTAFDAYDTFKIEAKYGFNKTTVGTFITDAIKDLIINTIIVTGGLLALFMWIYNMLGNLVFPIFVGVMILFILLVQFIGIYIMKLFNKFTPLEDGSLKDKIISLTERTNYPIKRVFVMDASKRSTKINAFFTGYGKNKTIALYDTTIEKLTEDEIISVLAHEIGHAKKKHVWKQMPFTYLTFAILFLFSYFIFSQADVSQAFGFTELNVGFTLMICLTLFTPAFIFLNLPSSMISRKHEYEADAYAAEYAGKEATISADKKLAKENYSNLVPHPFVVKMTYSHPTISQRIEAIERMDNG